MTATEEKLIKRFSLDDVLAAMRTVVAKFGADYVYKPPASGFEQGGLTCVYAEPDPNDSGTLIPSCLIAHVLVELGIPLQLFAGMCGSVTCIEHDLREVGYVFDLDAMDAMQRAQGVQDRAADRDSYPNVNECTWGKALQVAEETIEG